MTIPERFERERAVIEAFERQHELPQIRGGPVQSLWAREVPNLTLGRPTFDAQQVLSPIVAVALVASAMPIAAP